MMLYRIMGCCADATSVISPIPATRKPTENQPDKAISRNGTHFELLPGHMRSGMASILLLLAAGCAATPPAQPTTRLTPTPSALPPAVATSLAFDPPVKSHIPPSLLWRDDRQPSAFAGYRELDVEYFDLQTDDDQFFNDGFSTYERDAASDRQGVTYRN